MNKRIEGALIVTLAIYAFLPLGGTAADRVLVAQSSVAVGGLHEACDSPSRVNFADLPLRANVDSIETIENLCGVKLRVLGSTGSIEVHYVLQIRCVRRGTELVCTEYAAVRDDGAIIERRQDQLEGDVLVTGPVHVVWGGQALVPAPHPHTSTDLLSFLASESERACQPGFEGVASPSPLFAFALGTSAGQEPVAAPEFARASEQDWLTSGVQRLTVLEEEFETDVLGFLRVKSAVVCGPENVEQRAVYSLKRASTGAHSAPYCPDSACGRLAIVTFFGLLYLCNDFNGACQSTLDDCKCQPKVTRGNPAIRESDGTLQFELECMCQMKK